jgi:hypothetical protein
MCTSLYSDKAPARHCHSCFLCTLQPSTFGVSPSAPCKMWRLPLQSESVGAVALSTRFWRACRSGNARSEVCCISSPVTNQAHIASCMPSNSLCSANLCCRRCCCCCLIKPPPDRAAPAAPTSGVAATGRATAACGASSGRPTCLRASP